MRFYSFLRVTDFHDISYQSVRPLCWTIAEGGIYLFAGIMPTLRPLVRKVNGKGQWNKLMSRGSWGWESSSRVSKRSSQVLLRREISLVPGKLDVMSETSELEVKNVHSGRTSRNDDVERGL
jgi:hypothetical protein